MKKKLAVHYLALLLLLSGCSPLLRGRPDRLDYLRGASEQYLRSVYLKGSSWSIMAVDLESGRILLNRDVDRMLIPSSNLKLSATACALETLGPDYQIVTQIGYRGNVDSAGTLHGDLEIAGAGDPTISTRFTQVYVGASDGNPQNRLSAWADSIRSKGIHQVDGNLVGYDALSIGDALGYDWAWNDLKEWYAAEISSLIYTDDCIEITVVPADSIGEPAIITWAPDVGSAEVYADVVTSQSDVEPGIYFDRGLENNVITIWGSIPQGSQPQKRWVAVYDSRAYFMKAMRKALEQKGISVSGSALPAETDWAADSSFHPLFVDRSPRLSSIIGIINRDSQNLYAEMLIRVLGAEMIRRNDSIAMPGDDSFTVGRNKVRAWEASLVGASTGFAMVDGSGLSRRNLESASGLIKILVQMNRSPYRTQFLSSLATPGRGTLEERFIRLPDGIRLYAKTGSMSRVRSLSGYVGTSEKPKIAFSMICNNYLCNSAEVDATMENLCQLLALYLKEE